MTPTLQYYPKALLPSPSSDAKSHAEIRTQVEAAVEAAEAAAKKKFEESLKPKSARPSA